SIGHAVPRWAIEEHGEAWTAPENVVVNGPYKLTRLDPGDVAVLEANPTYYDADSVAIPVVNLFDVPQESTALALYEDGLLHTVRVPATDLDRVRNDPVLGEQYRSAPGTILYYYDFNALRPPFRSEEHTSELQSRENLVCRLLLEKKNKPISRNEQ